MNRSHNTKARKGGIVLTLRGLGKYEGKLDPFAVGDTVSGAIGYAAKASVDGTGTYTIHVRSEEQAVKLTRTKKLLDGTKVKIERHATLNTAKCIIQNQLITAMPDDTLASKLKGQGVTKVRSIGPENRLKIIHMAGTQVPPYIMIGLIKAKTEKYYNMPRTCRKCQQIGHITEACTGDPHCTNCSGNHISKGICKKPPNCINCGGDHRPLDKTCPTYLQEKSIIKIQVDQDIPLRLARKKFRAKAKGRYIPLPVERSTRENTDSEPESNAEQDTDAEERDLDPAVDTSEPEGEAEVEPESTKPPSPPRKPKKRKSKELSDKPRKRRSSQRSAPASDEEDDFILESEFEALRRRLADEETTTE